VVGQLEREKYFEPGISIVGAASWLSTLENRDRNLFSPSGEKR
jgi:hypothetical protein